MKKNFADESKERLSRILIQDKLANPNRLSEILRLELAEVLSSYMNLEKIKFSIHLSESGSYEIFIKAEASRIFSYTNT